MQSENEITTMIRRSKHVEKFKRVGKWWESSTDDMMKNIFEFPTEIF